MKKQAKKLKKPVTKKKKHILLVEDDPMILRMYKRKLLSEGFSLSMAYNGEEGLVALKKNIPDIVLLDIMMPKMSGLDMLNIVQKNKALKKVPIVILTNLGDREEDIKKCKELGAADYWVKANMRLDDLADKINAIISSRS